MIIYTGKCSKCGGEGPPGITEKNGKLYECDCARLKRLAESMPPYILKTKIEKAHLQTGIIDRIRDHLFISSSWVDMRAIIKAVMIKYTNKFIKITSDAEIRDVYVGSKSKSAKTDDYQGLVYNNLEDLVAGPSLLIIRLNEMSNKNKAAPGALEEALVSRTDYDRPTWILSNRARPFDQSSFAYSDSLGELIASSFERIEIPVISKEDNFVSSFFATPVFSQQVNPKDGEDLDEKQEKPKETKKKTPVKKNKPRPKIRPSDDEDGNPLSRYGGGLTVDDDEDDSSPMSRYGKGLS